MKRLKTLYIFIIILTIIIVGPAHVFPQPYLMAFRFPHYLEMMPTFLGVSWPITFAIYHWILLIIGVIGVINFLGILFYSKFKSVAIASSSIGLFLISLIILFFFFIFINVNPSTAIIYGLYCIILLIVDILTFKFLIKKQKAEAHEAS